MLHGAERDRRIDVAALKAAGSSIHQRPEVLAQVSWLQERVEGIGLYFTAMGFQDTGMTREEKKLALSSEDGLYRASGSITTDLAELTAHSDLSALWSERIIFYIATKESPKDRNLANVLLFNMLATSEAEELGNRLNPYM